MSRDPHKILEDVRRKMNCGNFYDAQQLAKAILNRYISKREYEQARKLSRQLALDFADFKQESLSADFCNSLILVYEAQNLEPDSELIDEVVNVFEACSSVGSNGPEKYRFLNRAIRWCKSNGSYDLEVKIHHAAALAYWKEKQYGFSQNHLIFCKDPEALSSMLREWQELGYKNEKSFFWLRCILILLSLGDFSTAEKLLEKCECDWDSAEVPAPLQLAYLVFNALKYEDIELYNQVRQKYHLIIRRDKCFQNLLDCAYRKIFNPVINHNVFANIFSSLLNPHGAEEE